MAEGRRWTGGYQRAVPLDVANRMRGGRDGKGRSSGGYDFSAKVKAGAASGPAFVSAPPWVQKPPTGTDVQADGTQAGLTAASGETVLASATLPANRVGVIRSLTLLGNSLVTSTDLLFRLRFDGSTVSGWNNLTILPRAAGSVAVSWTPEETFIMIPEGALVELTGQVNDGGTYQLSASFHGWHYGTELAAIAESGYR